MAENNQKPKTKVNPLDEGLGLDGLKGYNPQERTKEIKEESQTYEVTKNDGTKVTKSYTELSPAEKTALKTKSGVVPGGKTYVEKQYSVAPSSVGVAPTKQNINTLATLSGAAATAAVGAKGGPVAQVFSALLATKRLIDAGAEQAENERKYREALREFNEKVAKESVIAGDWEKDEEGNLVFMPDYSKVGKDINVAASGAKIADLFDLEKAKDPNVYFTDDGVLHVNVNPAFANTEEYQRIADSISTDYAGLTPDTADVEQYLRDIKQRITSAFDQYRFAVNRVAGYKNKLPNADVETIMDAASGEIGAVLSDSDKKDWPVKVYRDGEIIESNAKEVLDHVYDMGDKYKRNDYIEELMDSLNDDSIPDNEKAYILAEYNLLFTASDADTQEGGPDKERKKYVEMLDQDFAVTFLKSSGIIRGLDNFVDWAAGTVSQGAVDDILLANQEYLEPEEVAKNFGSVAGTAFDIYATWKIMQGIEYKVVRPTLGAASRGIGKTLVASGSDKFVKIGEKLINASWSPVADAAGNIASYRTALNLDVIKNACLDNVIMAFGSETGGLSIRLLAKGVGDFVAYTMGEFAINAMSDAIFDAAKLGTAILSGEIKTSDEAAEYWNNEIGQDIALDLVLQYGPQGMLDLHTTADAMRLQHIEPYTQGVVKARANYGEALDAVNMAKTTKTSAKKMKELNNNLTIAKNELTKAETNYDDALKKWGASRSQSFGAKLAGAEARLTEYEMYRRFQESVMDENAAGTALVRAAYAASGGDVELFNKLMNSVSNNLRTLTRITANELASDKWAKGTGDALHAFKQKYSDISDYNGNLSKADVDYIKAKNELLRYTEAADGDKEKIAAAEKNYAKYIEAVSPDRAARLDELMDTMRTVINKTNESAINAGIQTEEDIQTKRSATGFQSHDYIPMYLKRKNKSSHYVIGQERNLDHTWDRGDFWDIDNLENPVLNTMTYVNYTARNIAVNERNKAIVAATEIPGMRTHRTDFDNEIIRTEDGNAYKHSDIVEHMEAKIDARLKKISKVKKDAPTETEFFEEKNKILYGKADGTHEDLVEELDKSSAASVEGAKSGKTLETLKREEESLKKKVSKTRRAQRKAEVDNLFKPFSRFSPKDDLSDMLKDNATPPHAAAFVDKALETLLFNPGSKNPYIKGSNSNSSDIAATLRWNLERVFSTDYGAEAFKDVLSAAGGDVKKAALDFTNKYIDALLKEYPNFDEIDISDLGIIEDSAKSAIIRMLEVSQGEALSKPFFDRAVSDFEARKQQGIDWWNQTEDLRRNLGVEAYAFGQTAPIEMGNGGEAYGVSGFGFEGQEGNYTAGPERISISIMAFESLPEMKTTIVHEAAHSALRRAANRVPLVQDALRLLGFNEKISRQIAMSRDATELIAYMTEQKFAADMASKDRAELSKMFLSDKTVQRHLDNISAMASAKNVSFKKKFIDVIQDIITFTKAKLTKQSSLSNVKTFAEFYYGLVNGKFAPDMRVNATGAPVELYDYWWRDADTNKLNVKRAGDYVLDWGKVQEDLTKYTSEINRLQDDIAVNKEAQEAAKATLRANVEARINALKDYYNNTYGKFGYTTSVRVSWDKIDNFIADGNIDGLATYLENLKDRTSLARPTNQELTTAEFNKQVKGLEIEMSRSLNKNFPGLTGEQKREVYSRILGEFRRKAAESGDIASQQIADEVFARNVGYPITYFDGGDEKVAYIDGPLAKPIYEMCTRSENVADRNYIQKALEGAAKLKRYTTTAIDVTRALPNLLRDTLRGDIMSGGTDYAGARKLFTEILDAEGLTVEQKAKAMESIELAIKVAQGETLNAAVENRTERGLQDMVRETRQEGKNMVSRIIWDVGHGRIGHALETPMNVAEMYTRRRMAQSAYVREYKNAKYTSTSFEERLSKAYDAGVNAGMENTTNFSRRGSAVGSIARYVPYFQQNFANIESANNAFLKDPAGVATRAAIFAYSYVMMLAETLKKEETRRAYYNLSDYDRKNNVVFSLDGETLVTIPLDESLSALITPWRRTIETLNGIDPATFAGIFTDTLLDLSPIDLDGFTEGDGLNVRRGIEKASSEMMPSLVTELIQTISGYNLYYGSSNAVTEESLRSRGQTVNGAGDLTTTSANSKILRKVADATGIPQWQLQQAIANFGGNVGQYVLNSLDQLAGATKEEQGGKEFIQAVFKSMTGTDSTNVKSQFYNGINKLQKEKTKVIDKLNNINDKCATATGTELADLKKQYQAVKDEYAMKVSNFVSQYLSVYDITGGLEKSQATQIYYLFNLYDDDTVYESGSVGEYYQNLARQQAYNEADAWAAPVLDKYYDQTQNVYKDASGVWHYSSPYGEQAYYNTIYGRGMKYQVGLRNLLEGATNSLKKARSDAYDARSAAMENKDYDLYDQIGADFDAQVVEAISPYIREYGAEDVLNNSSVMDYLEEWFFVPSSYMKTKKGRFVPSLAHNASKQRAFVRPYIKSLYNVSTVYDNTERESLLNPEVFPNE